ncbi:hypothetical protein IT408_01415 [Candidatus Uhrbacteria bacterium]|nr:hypothetical protein [Candidatus Uhrbacteria bacterium]
MSFRLYVLLMFFSTTIAWTAWTFVLFNVQPGVSGLTGLVLFYITLVISLMGSLTLIGLAIRLLISRGKEKGLEFRDVRISFRHAVLLSILSVGALILSSNAMFTWWSCLLLIIIAMLIEGGVLLLHSGRR